MTLSERSAPGPFQRVTRDGGQDLKWADDGASLTWVFANVFSHLEVGTAADLVVLNEDPLDTIRNSTSIRYVMKGGELYDADTLDMIWPGAEPLRSSMYVDFGPPPRSGWDR